MSRTEPARDGVLQVLDGTRRRWILRDVDTVRVLPVGLAALLAMPLPTARSLIDETPTSSDIAPDAAVLPPVDVQEVWAAGVTYARSRDERIAESRNPSVYDLVYDAVRPELFFKCPASRVVTSGQPIGIRADSSWNVPEAELGVVINSSGEIFGYVVGNDVSSRSIEGENPLYLPQAKFYDRSCPLGTTIVPSWLVAEPFDISLRIDRAGRPVYRGGTSTTSMARTTVELVDWLTAALPMPSGAVLLTGTGIVPEEDVTLQPGDVVTVVIAGLGDLINPVVSVGRPVPTKATSPADRATPA